MNWYTFDKALDGSRSATFKLAVSENDRDIIEDERSWPERVIVRNFRYNNGRRTADGPQDLSHHQYGDRISGGDVRMNEQRGPIGD